MGHGRSLPFASASIIHSEIHVILVSSTGLGERTEGSNYSGSQHADKHIWHLISELCESPEWSLDEALLEFTQHRGDLAALLQPRPKLSRPAAPLSSNQSKGGKSSKGMGKSSKGQKGGKQSVRWVSEIWRGSQKKTLCMRYQSGKCSNKDCRYEHACGYPKAVVQLVEEITLPQSMTRSLTDLRKRVSIVSHPERVVDQLELTPSTSAMDLAEEQPQPSAQTSHFATTQQAILAPQVSDITDQPYQDPAVVEISNMDEDVSMQDPPSTTHIPIMHNFSQELLTPWGCLGVKIFVDICSGADKPLSAALQNLGYPALAVDLLWTPGWTSLMTNFWSKF